MHRASAHPANGSALLARAPRRPWRWGIDLFIAAFLLFQIARPLGYYLGDDPFEERFAWRMFSPLQLRPCEFSVFEQKGSGTDALRPVDFDSVLQSWWIDGLERNRPRIVGAVLERVCALHEVESVHYEHRCTARDGTPQPPLRAVLHCVERARQPGRAAP